MNSNENYDKKQQPVPGLRRIGLRAPDQKQHKQALSITLTLGHYFGLFPPI